MSAISGKYFVGVHDDCMRSGVVEAAVNDDHYLVRFDDLIGFSGGSKWPEELAVVAVSDMAGSGDEDGPPPWSFFDNPEQRARYDAWLKEAPADRKPRVVPLRPESQEKKERDPAEEHRQYVEAMTNTLSQEKKERDRQAIEALRNTKIVDKLNVTTTAEEQAELRRQMDELMRAKRCDADDDMTRQKEE